MSDGRDKLNDFSLLKSLVGGKSIKEKTERMRKAHAEAKERNAKVPHAKRAKAESTEQNAKPATQRHSKHTKSTRQERVNQQRTPFRMPQFGQKQHDELVVELPEEAAEAVVISINPEKQQFKEEQRLFKWLCQRFPKCFNPKDKRPLKIGISQDIEVIYQNEHFAPVDQYILRNVLKRYVGDTRYQRAVLEHKMRFNLQGMPVDDYAEEHISYAKQRLEEIAEKAELRAQGIDIKEYYQKKREQERLEKEAELKSKEDDENTLKISESTNTKREEKALDVTSAASDVSTDDKADKADKE